MCVCRTPVDHQRKAIKRVIGLPGDWISVPETKEIRKIPEGHCWVEGDNGSVSRDSRTYGPVPLGLVQGRVTHVVWPPRKIGRVDKRVPEGRVMPQRNL
uniref:Mitochondrial inner membrane protease subunit 2 n=1 Tax=Aegilops tauschii subsp. strangulata TaxID=200361 RepID=A0A453LBD4_AEGTS